MARLPHFTRTPLITSQAALLALTILLCAFALFMCASHSRKWRRWSACYGSYGHNPVIQLESQVMTIDGSSSGEDGASVWQKNILMGGKCELPDFSGVIIYNSDGNIVKPQTNARPLLTWK